MRPAIAPISARLARPDVIAEGQIAASVLRMRSSHAALVAAASVPADAEARRDGEAVADVALAIAEQLVVDGQHQRVISGGLGALGHFAGEAAVRVDEDLHPARRRPGRGDVLQRADRAVADAVDRAGGGRGARRSAFAVGPEQPGQPGRPDAERHRQRAAEQRDGEVARRGAVQRTRQQRDIVERRFVAAERALVLGAAIGEIEHGQRQHAASGGAHFGDAARAASVPPAQHMAWPVTARTSTAICPN